MTMMAPPDYELYIIIRFCFLKHMLYKIDLCIIYIFSKFSVINICISVWQ
jgi:hypothetical protein